jgi:hypothetical protein
LLLETLGDALPTPVTMAVEQLGEKPNRQREDASVNFNVVGVTARSAIDWFHMDAVIPSADEGIVLAGLHFARGSVNVLPVEDARADGDHAKQPRPQRDGGPRLPPLGNCCFARSGLKRDKRPAHLAEQAERLHAIPRLVGSTGQLRLNKGTHEGRA